MNDFPFFIVDFSDNQLRRQIGELRTALADIRMVNDQWEAAAQKDREENEDLRKEMARLQDELCGYISSGNHQLEWIVRLQKEQEVLEEENKRLRGELKAERYVSEQKSSIINEQSRSISELFSQRAKMRMDLEAAQDRSSGCVSQDQHNLLLAEKEGLEVDLMEEAELNDELSVKLNEQKMLAEQAATYSHRRLTLIKELEKALTRRRKSEESLEHELAARKNDLNALRVIHNQCVQDLARTQEHLQQETALSDKRQKGIEELLEQRQRDDERRVVERGCDADTIRQHLHELKETQADLKAAKEDSAKQQKDALVCAFSSGVYAGRNSGCSNKFLTEQYGKTLV